jgi:integrative and conjugative element protein (TIGR02256 family)
VAVQTTALNALDEIYLHFDREDEPWSVHLEVGVEGRIDGERLAAAVRAAADHHPMARAQLVPVRATDRRYHWKIAGELGDLDLTEVQCEAPDDLARAREAVLSRSPTLDRPGPFALLLAHHDDGDVLVLNLHHAAGDGMSALRLMGSIARARQQPGRPNGGRDAAREGGPRCRRVRAVAPGRRRAPAGGAVMDDLPAPDLRGMRRLSLPSRRLRSDSRVFVPPGLLDALEAEGRRWAPDETGGMLVGYRTDNGADADLVITDVIPAGPRAVRERVRFAPDGEWQQRRLEELYEESGRVTTFLGDWHTHPRGGVRPSRVDRRTFRTVAKEKGARAPFPLMLIVGLWQGWRQVGAHVVDAKGRPREVTIVELGCADGDPSWRH